MWIVIKKQSTTSNTNIILSTTSLIWRIKSLTKLIGVIGSLCVQNSVINISYIKNDTLFGFAYVIDRH